ncbi:MAG: DUF2088 domain-containing protein [Lachnospiraceae bacterium]|nr:DUF2088 domain-containing protein [Lachnospiraceae bacterium]
MYSSLSKYVSDIRLPKFVKVRQLFDDRHLTEEEIRASLEKQLKKPEIAGEIGEGASVCITCGSRGIDNLPFILKTLVDFCCGRKAFPFIIPAMGSHGGATADGQREILTSLGVTEETMGCPVRSSMDTVETGRTPDGQSVWLDAFAAKADKIIVVNRIKPHTSFRGKYESGLMKMMAIGLGKQKGADACHSSGYKYMAERIPEFGEVHLSRSHIAFGVGILENAFDRTAKIAVLTRDEIRTGEPELLAEAFSMMPKIRFDSCDVLVVDEIGKDISGGGMDPNITGAFATPYASGGLHAQMRCILALTEKTHGSAYGMGAADVVSKRLFDAVDFEKTYPNSITSTALAFSKLPIVMPCDRDAIALCVKSCSDINRDSPRIIHIKNTLSLGEIGISEAMLAEAEENPLTEILGSPRELAFDAEGNLREPWV